MILSEFDYHLPPELIAQHPLAERDRSRMLIIDRSLETFRDSYFSELPSLLSPGDVVVVNNTRVVPARLVGHRLRESGQEGTRVELLLVKKVDEKEEWECLGKPARALRPNDRITFAGGRLLGEVLQVLEEGARRVRFNSAELFDELLEEIGITPLPPYIKRNAGDQERSRQDAVRYQTIYAKHRGAIAAPTAGLHFSPKIIKELKDRGVSVVEITHHVGIATFQPIRCEQVEDHHLAGERYEISEIAAREINESRPSGTRVIAVGTTTARALESAAGGERMVQAGSAETDLYIYPGYPFRMIDGLITNFHLPRSTLLLLVAAFAGRQLTLRAYRHAVDARYRFYSYGDCMLVL
jgi:S-adenosylmethionine:tRNA ribosyltransferase-isomerase